jgi:uncharacterized protein YciI
MNPKQLTAFALFIALLAGAFGPSLVAAPKQFIYVIKPVSRLQVEANWTEADNAVAAEHFAYLKGLLAEGRIILAGKTDGLDERTFGIVVFEAESMEAAERTMKEDPAVKAGIMTGEVFGYSIALSRS